MKYRSVFNDSKGNPISYNRPDRFTDVVYKTIDFTVLRVSSVQWDYLYKDICFTQCAGFSRDKVESLLDAILLGIEPSTKYTHENLSKAIEIIASEA